MQVSKDMVFADRDKRRKGRQVKVVHVEDGYATVEVVTDSESAIKTSIGKSTDIRVDRLRKEYDFVGRIGKTKYVGPEDLKDAVYVTLPKIDRSGAGILFTPSFEPQSEIWMGNDDEIESELLAALSEPISAKVNSGGYFGITLQVPDVEEDDDLIENESDLEDALRTAGYHWLAPVEDLIAVVEENVYAESTPEIVVRVMHQIIKERLVG